MLGLFNLLKGIKKINEYYPNGELLYSTHVNRFGFGVKVGLFTRYYTNGNKMCEYNLVPVRKDMSVCNGEINTWYPNGNKCSHGVLERNQFVNKILTYYYDGKIQSEINFSDPEWILGRRNQVWFYDGYGMELKSNRTEGGVWYNEDKGIEKINIHEIRKRHFQYFENLTVEDENEEGVISVYVNDKTHPPSS